MICRSANQGRRGSLEAKTHQVKLIDEHINHPYGVLYIYVIVETLVSNAT
ncbi:hypothetical protein AWB68_08762 [Caballeronia choica]|uniref:Uncharacterized protein n=1 Tax=Caballeronia choica TaxID=326476 RepID=A0A158L4W5_9BURK|nr:hypothetical protein AWB68_08762 [Caballeronia choica]